MPHSCDAADPIQRLRGYYYQCGYCGKLFKTYAECKAHLPAVAPTVYEYTACLTCPNCGEKLCATRKSEISKEDAKKKAEARAKELLDIHTPTCVPPPPAKKWSAGCPYCGKVFTAYTEEEIHRLLDEHMAVCPKRPPAWSGSCPYCGKVFRADTSEELGRLIDEHMAVCPKKPAPPEEWTHKLVVGFRRMPWATQAGVTAVFDTAIIPLINKFEWLAGFDFVKKTMDWEGLTVTLFYRQRSSPVVTAAVIGAAIVKIALLTIALMLAAGFLIMALSWYEKETSVASREQTLEDLLKQGLITAEQYAEWTEKAEAPPVWEKYIPWAILGFLGLMAIREAPKVVERVVEAKKE